MVLTNVKVVHQTSLRHIECNPERLGLLSPTHSQGSQQHSEKIMLQSFLIEKFTFLKPRHAKAREIVPRSMAMEALSW